MFFFFNIYIFFSPSFIFSVPPSSGKPTARRPRSRLPPRPSSSLSRDCCRGTCRSSWRAAPTRSSWEPSCTRSGPVPAPHAPLPEFVSAARSNSALEPPLMSLPPNVPFPERQHHRAAAEGGLRPLRGLVHGRLHPGGREAPSCREVATPHPANSAEIFCLLLCPNATCRYPLW